MGATPREARPPRTPPTPGGGSRRQESGVKCWLIADSRSPSAEHATRGGAAAARWAHNPKVEGSNPSPATMNAGAERRRRFLLRFTRARGEMLNLLRTTADFAVDLVYPKRCAGCDRRGTWLCTECERALERFAAPWCDRCGVPAAMSCRCSSMPDVLGRVRSVGPFEGWLRGTIVHFKYHGEWARADQLGALVAAVAADLGSVDALIPVPLHTARLRQRGFNQSLLVASHAGVCLNTPVEQTLIRIRRTAAQVQLGAQARQSNVSGAFSLAPRHEINGRSFILIDDVITTGSTLAACAEVLLRAGATNVSVATVAREL